jgi:hypothetical protein
MQDALAAAVADAVAHAEVSAERHLVVCAERPAGDVARDVAAWLDRTWA